MTLTRCHIACILFLMLICNYIVYCKDPFTTPSLYRQNAIALEQSVDFAIKIFPDDESDISWVYYDLQARSRISKYNTTSLTMMEWVLLDAELERCLPIGQLLYCLMSQQEYSSERIF